MHSKKLLNIYEFYFRILEMNLKKRQFVWQIGLI